MNSNHEGKKKRAFKAVILLENEVQVRDWISRRELYNEGTIVALSPLAMFELDIQGIKYKIPEDYYTPNELYSLGMANFQNVEELCRVIDDAIAKWCPAANERKVKPALFNIFNLKMIYDAMTIRIFQLSTIFNAEKPDAVYIYNSPKFSLGYQENLTFFFNNRESLYSQLLELEGWNKKINYLDIDLNNEKVTGHVSSSLVEKYKKYFIWNPYLSDLAMVAKKNGFMGIYFWIRYNLFSWKRAPLALLGPGYDWDDSIEEIVSEHIGPVYRVRHDPEMLLDNNVYLSIDHAWDELYGSQKVRDFFSYLGMNFLPILKERLEFIVKKSSVACLNTEKEMENLINRRKIKAVISSVISTSLDHSAARAAHNKGIPVIIWQHGAYGAFHNQIVNYDDLISSDYHFVFGDGVKEQYEQAARSYGTNLISIGSASLDRLQIKFSKEKLLKTNKILYITSSEYHNNRYISHYPPFSDNHFWRTQKAIIDILGKHAEYSVIMKLHPCQLNTKINFLSYVNQRSFGNFSFVKNEKSTGEFLSWADIVVIDFPSTVLLQSLTTNKPLFVYMGHAPFDVKPGSLLNTRAVCHENLEDFILCLDDFLTNRMYLKDLYNKDYLKMFGTSSENGPASKRAAMALRQIIDTHGH